MEVTPKIALVGNPNSGKSSLFNILTGLNQKIGNFPGVTVDKKTGHCHLSDSRRVEVIDLPGTYSIYPNSSDERIVFDILSNKSNEMHPDVVVVIVDASNFKRSLLLFTQIHDLGIPSVLVLNMMDLVEKTGHSINVELLSEELGVPIVPMKARTGEGIERLKDVLAKDIKVQEKPIFDPGKYVPEAISAVKEAFPVGNDYQAYQLLQQFRINDAVSGEDKAKLEEISDRFNFNSHELRKNETLERYRSINEFVAHSVKESAPIMSRQWTETLD
ncbi:MAG: FeoB small GTPase domain-containing protein, partial [Cyclobacteriaceae bacterium]